MSAKTAIEWTDASWPVTVGCDHVSAGCDNCYAARLASGRLKNRPPYDGVADGGRFNGTVRSLPDRLDWPLRWRKPRRIFVCSMSDLFHEAVPDEFIADVWHVMAQTPQHTYQILTKRHARMRSWVRTWCSHPKWTTPLRNVWLGVSVENQQWADIRIPALLDTPAAVRWISAEPLLGPVKLEFIHYFDTDCGGCSGLVSPAHEPACGNEPGAHWGLDWVVAGGESGPGARPADPDWFRLLRDQCQAAGVPFLFKQWGNWSPDGDAPIYPGVPPKNHSMVWCASKKLAGRELDGRTWDEYPADRTPVTTP